MSNILHHVHTAWNTESYLSVRYRRGYREMDWENISDDDNDTVSMDNSEGTSDVERERTPCPSIKIESHINPLL